MRRREAITAIGAYADGFRDGANTMLTMWEKHQNADPEKLREVLRNAAACGAEAAREIKFLI